MNDSQGNYDTWLNKSDQQIFLKRRTKSRMRSRDKRLLKKNYRVGYKRNYKIIIDTILYPIVPHSKLG